jgi:murein L,D-transpeptidase YafK
MSVYGGWRGLNYVQRGVGLRQSSVRLFGIGAACTAAALLTAAAPAQAQLARELGLIPAEPAFAVNPALPTESSFALEQLRHARVRDARVAKRFEIKRAFHERGIRYPAAEIFLRIFKRERSLEVWVRPEDATAFTLLKTYPVCALAGELGPKRRQGDNQTPEGFYYITLFNPYSEYHLSLHLNYPNARDRTAAAAGTALGGDIFIHGGCSSEGCLAITDDGISELYWLAVEARAAGQRRIPVHIFPARLEQRDLEILQRSFADRPELGAFWASLKPAYDFFESTRQLPYIGVTAAGVYSLTGAMADADPAGAAPELPAAAPRRVPLGTPVGGG